LQLAAGVAEAQQAQALACALWHGRCGGLGSGRNGGRRRATGCGWLVVVIFFGRGLGGGGRFGGCAFDGGGGFKGGGRGVVVFGAGDGADGDDDEQKGEKESGRVLHVYLLEKLRLWGGRVGPGGGPSGLSI